MRRLHVLLPLVFLGCAFFAPPLPPFRYVSVELRKGSNPPHHEAVGLVYRIVNTGEVAITLVRTTFWVFGPDDNPYPAAGRSHVQADARVEIGPGVEQEICTSLDDLFYAVPDGEIRITAFQIARVEMEDGSVWSDRFSQFTYPNEIENVETSGESAPP